MKFQDLIDAFESAGYEPQSYSGRAMYGAKCLGVLTRDSAAKVVCSTIAEYMSNLNNDPDDQLDEVNELLNELAEAREDSMGLDVIVYWPDIEWQADDSDDDDSDE